MLLTCALALALAASPDDLAPKLDHQPLEHATRGQVAQLRTRIRTATGAKPLDPAAFVRPVGINGYTRVPLAPVPGAEGMFLAEIPASLVAGDFDYYLEAFDEEGNGPGRSGSPESPHRVRVLAPDAPTANALTPAQAVEVVRKQLPPRRSHLPTVALFGTGSAVTATGIAFLVANRLIREDFQQAVAGNHDGPSERDVQLANDLGKGGIACIAVGAALLAGGITWLAWKPAPAEASAPPATPERTGPGEPAPGGIEESL